MKRAVKIFLFCDALGFELAQQYRFMVDLLPFRRPVVTQFGYSSTAVPTILTGASPVKHGHFSFFHRAAPGGSPFGFFRYLQFLMYPRRFFDHHRVRHQLSRFIAGIFGYRGYFNLYRVPFERLPYFDYCEKNDIFAPGGLGPVRNLADELAGSPVDSHISDWRKGDAANLAEAEALLRRGEKEFFFIYTAELDGMLHFHIHDPEEVQRRFDAFAQQVQKLMETARANYENVSFYLLSDHGMTPLASTVDVRKRVEATRLKFGRDYLGCYDSTMFRFYELAPGAFQVVEEALAELPGHWLSAGEEKNYGIDFPDRRYGDRIFLLDPGIQIVPSDMGDKPIPGMHGFSPQDKDSTACILSNVPLPVEVNSIADFFRLMTGELKVLENDRA